MVGQGVWFLVLNASVVWAVVGGGLMWFVRMKSLVALILIAPFIIAPAFAHLGGVGEALSFYSTSLLYGLPGLIVGVLYADYQRVKQYFARSSKLAFLARGGMALSAVYIVGYFGQRIIMDNPMVQFVLGFVNGGDRVQELVDKLDSQGVVQAAICFAGSVSLLAFSRYREERSKIQALEGVKKDEGVRS